MKAAVQLTLVHAKVKDEHGFCSKLGKDMAKRQLEAHWDAWFKEEDVRLLASTGLHTTQ